MKAEPCIILKLSFEVQRKIRYSYKTEFIESSRSLAVMNST